MAPKTLNKTDTVTLIRSLVAVQSNNYSLKKLLDDFKSEVGYNMPIFEYKTALDFLKSIPQVVKVIEDKKNVFLKLVSAQDYVDVGSAVQRSGLIPEGNAASPITSKARAPTSQNRGKSKKEEVEKKTSSKKRRRRVRKTFDLVPEDENGEVQQATKLTAGDVNCYGCLTGDPELEVGLIDKCLTTAILRENDIPTINVAYYIDIGDDVEVFVHEVCNPHKFYLRLKKFRNELQKLMATMQIFYNNNKQDYRVEAYSLRNGDICAAGFNVIPKYREWYRAKVLCAGERSSRVFFIDYGTTLKIRNSDLRYLDRKFAFLPAQAIKGVQANIRPSDGKYWSEDSCKIFYELVYEEEGVATILNIDSQNNSLTVNLSFGMDGDISLAQLLIEKECALPVCSPDGKVTIYESERKDFLRPMDINMSRRPKIQGGIRP